MNTAQPLNSASLRRSARVVAASSLASLLLAAVLPGVSAVHGRTPDARPADQERALAARQRGELLPLAQILAAVERELPGRMIEVELDDDDGRRVYELEWLLPDGRVVEIKLDARSGQWLKLEGARLETVFHKTGSPTPPRGKP